MTSARRKVYAIAPSDRIGLSRTQAAEYIGFTPTEFDHMVRQGVMPQPRRFGDRQIWDRREVDAAFSALPQAPTSGKAKVDPFTDLAV